MSRYRRLIGRLIYLTITRPDLCYPVHILSQFMASPRAEHYEVDSKVVNLKSSPGQPDKAYFFPAQTSLQPTACCDAVWRGCKLTRHSLSGYIVFN